MKMTSGWMRVGVVGAMMVAAIAAGAQTTAEDAAQAANAQAAEVQAKAAEAQSDVALQQADVQAKQIEVQAHQADLQAQAQKVWSKVDALGPEATQVQLIKLRVQNSTNSQVQRARIQAQLAKLSGMNSVESRVQSAQIQAQLAALQARLQVDRLPEEARLEAVLAPMRAEMMARSATMQAHMMTRGLMLQEGMVSMGDPQVKDELFAGTEKFANGASDVTDVNLGPDMLGMVTGKHGGNVAKKLNFMVVRTYEYPKPGMYNLADVDVYRQKLKAGNWNCFIHTHEAKSGESTDICNRALPNGQGNEMVILTVEPKELTFIHMSGNGSLADLGKLGSMGGYGGNIPTPPEPPTPPAPQSPRQ